MQKIKSKKEESREIKYKGKYLELSEEVIDNHAYERVKLRSGVKVIPVQKN